MLNMMGNKENRVWRGYFCRTDPFGKDAGTKIRTESQIKPGKRKRNELITRKTKLSQEIGCEAKSGSKVRMQRETDQKTAESIKRSKMAPQDRVRQRTNRNQ